MFHVRHASIGLLLSAAAYFWLGLLMLSIPAVIVAVTLAGGDAATGTAGIAEVAVIAFIGLFCWGLAVIVLTVMFFLERRAQWAWFAAMVLAVMYVSSLFVFFALVMIPGLINDRTQFGL